MSLKGISIRYCWGLATLQAQRFAACFRVVAFDVGARRVSIGGWMRAIIGPTDLVFFVSRLRAPCQHYEYCSRIDERRFLGAQSPPHPTPPHRHVAVALRRMHTACPPFRYSQCYFPVLTVLNGYIFPSQRFSPVPFPRLRDYQQCYFPVLTLLNRSIFRAWFLFPSCLCFK